MRALISSLGKAGLARLGLARTPLAVSWEVTLRCTRHCRYCGSPQSAATELTTSEAHAVIDDLADSGTRFLSLTGGEPLVREDLGALVQHARRRGLRPSLSTNGDLLPARLDELEGLGVVLLSLDGSAEVNDRLRGRGAYAATVAAAEALRSRGWRFDFTTVLSRDNLDQVDVVLDLARRFGVRVSFQPAYALQLRCREANACTPEPVAYRAVVRDLLGRKRRGDTAILNSASVLDYLLRFPDAAPIQCAGGRLFLRIAADGGVQVCGMSPDRPLVGVDIRDGVRRALERLRPPDCDACWCARRTGVNLAWSGRLDAVLPDWWR